MSELLFQSQRCSKSYFIRVWKVTLAYVLNGATVLTCAKLASLLTFLWHKSSLKTFYGNNSHWETCQRVHYLYLHPPWYDWALFLVVFFNVHSVQVVHLAAADLPALSLVLPGSSPCGVGFGVTSSRSSVNRGEHVDQVLHRQQGRAAWQRHVIIWVFLLYSTRWNMSYLGYTKLNIEW